VQPSRIAGLSAPSRLYVGVDPLERTILAPKPWWLPPLTPPGSVHLSALSWCTYICGQKAVNECYTKGVIAFYSWA